jgi:hypothetical protein
VKTFYEVFYFSTYLSRKNKRAGIEPAPCQTVTSG